MQDRNFNRLRRILRAAVAVGGLLSAACDHHSTHACSCFAFGATTAGSCSCAHTHHHTLVAEGREAGLDDGANDGLDAGTVAAFEAAASGSRPQGVNGVPPMAVLDGAIDSHYRSGYEAGYEDAYAASYRAAALLAE